MRKALTVIVTSDKFTAAGGRLAQSILFYTGGQIRVRRWVKPFNRKTPAQQAVRDALSFLAAAWSWTLTDEQRLLWGQFASTLPFRSKLGTAYTICGFDAFQMANGARMVAGLDWLDDAPRAGGFDQATAARVTFREWPQQVEIEFNRADQWANELGGALTVRVCPQWFSPGANFYEGPFTYLGSILGSVPPPATPGLLVPSWNLIFQGGQYAVAMRSVRADGRCSEAQIVRGIAV